MYNPGEVLLNCNHSMKYNELSNKRIAGQGVICCTCKQITTTRGEIIRKLEKLDFVELAIITIVIKPTDILPKKIKKEGKS